MNVDGDTIVRLMLDCGIKVDEENIDFDSKFVDLGIDSLDMANLLLTIEEKYGVSIPDEAVDELVSVKAIVSFLNDRN